MEGQKHRRAGRQKRPRVPDALRKRAARACLPCRQHKEKCTIVVWIRRVCAF
ncbi:hypothetical protein BDV59DRAFT_56680 [Aspergillus ambiguus]|uniref:uncharacterized protein n=1 Tax=Aspergillus ambiguus TaxID=176160 RepID=UPI003CCE04BA